MIYLLENGFRTPLGKFCDDFAASVLKPLIYIMWVYKNKNKCRTHTQLHGCVYIHVLYIYIHMYTYMYSITFYLRQTFPRELQGCLVDVYVLTPRPIKWLVLLKSQCV
jgi:hypothetical protein